MGMAFKNLKSLLAATFSLLILLSCNITFGQTPDENGAIAGHSPEATEQKGEKLKPGDILMEHVLDAHEFHFLTIGETHVSIPLPVILYSPQRGFSVFMSSRFEHGHAIYDGYRMIDEHFMEELEHSGVDTKKAGFSVGKIIPVTADGIYDTSVTVYDLSMTRNVVQMLLASILFIWLMFAIANKYKKNGSMSAPSGAQGLLEPIIIFIRDEVGKSQLGRGYEKYMPYLLSIFFFILINTMVGLIPGSANVTGNIAFTLVLGVISFVAILYNSNKHFWGHIFNPPTPGFVKPILVLVEILGVFTKPFALIIRLFANMIAGHMIIICLIMLIFIFGAMNGAAGFGFSPISLIFTIFIYFIEILVAFIQAFIFTSLTAVFIAQAFEGGKHDEAHGEAVHI